MTEMPTRMRSPAPARRAGPLAALMALGLLTQAARAQLPQPLVPDVRQRSGLFTRFVPIEPLLPVDRDRDLWYDTQWQPRHRICWGHWPNAIKDGGLYGHKLPAGCTASRYPFFRGSPGASSIGPGCQPMNKYQRLIGNLVHPFRPVGSYYDGGSYVPIYDLDPLIPGPGPFPWNHYLNQHEGG